MRRLLAWLSRLYHRSSLKTHPVASRAMQYRHGLIMFDVTRKEEKDVQAASHRSVQVTGKRGRYGN